MDVGLVYGVLAAGAALAAGLAGTKAANLTREAGGSQLDVVASRESKGGRQIAQMELRVREEISERSAGAQSPSAWLATSTALLGVASTRPAIDVVGIAFVTIGIGLVIVAIRALWSANAAAELPSAREAFKNWYLPWLLGASVGVRPTDEQIGEAFANENPGCSRAMMRFHIWPYESPQIGNTVPPSEWIREREFVGLKDKNRS